MTQNGEHNTIGSGDMKRCGANNTIDGGNMKPKWFTATATRVPGNDGATHI